MKEDSAGNIYNIEINSIGIENLKQYILKSLKEQEKLKEEKEEKEAVESIIPIEPLKKIADTETILTKYQALPDVEQKEKIQKFTP